MTLRKNEGDRKMFDPPLPQNIRSGSDPRYPVHEKINLVLESHVMAHFVGIVILNNFYKGTHILKCHIFMIFKENVILIVEISLPNSQMLIITHYVSYAQSVQKLSNHRIIIT